MNSFFHGSLHFLVKCKTLKFMLFLKRKKIYVSHEEITDDVKRNYHEIAFKKCKGLLGHISVVAMSILKVSLFPCFNVPFNLQKHVAVSQRNPKIYNCAHPRHSTMHPTAQKKITTTEKKK